MTAVFVDDTKPTPTENDDDDDDDDDDLSFNPMTTDRQSTHSSDQDEEDAKQDAPDDVALKTAAFYQITSDDAVVNVNSMSHDDNNNKNNNMHTSNNTQSGTLHSRYAHVRTPSRVRTLSSAYHAAKSIQHKSTKTAAEQLSESESVKIPAALLCLELDRRRTKAKLCESLLVFIVYFLVYISCIILMKDFAQGHALQRSVTEIVLDKSTIIGANSVAFEEIKSLNQFYEWFENIWITHFFAESWYSGANDTIDDALKNTINFQTKLIGGFRLEQTRGSLNDGVYCYAGNYEGFAPQCQSGALSTQTRIQCDGRTECSSSRAAGTVLGTGDSGVDVAFEYRCDQFKYCGYFLDFAFNDSNVNDPQRAIDLMQDLKRYRWLDSQTRSIHIKANFYNNNYKRWVLCDLSLNIDLAGNFYAVEAIRAINIEIFNENSTVHVVVVVLQAIYVLFILYFTFQEIFRLVYHYRRRKSHATKKIAAQNKSPNIRDHNRRNKHLRDNADNISVLCCVISGAKTKFWYRLLAQALYEWVFLFINYYIIVLHVLLIANSQRQAMIKLSTADIDFSTFRDLSQIGALENHFATLNAINIIIATFNGMSFFQVTDSGEALFIALQESLPLFLSYLPMYLLSIVGFAFCGYVLFGLEYLQFSTFEHSFLSILEINFGIFDGYTAMVTVSDFMGKLYLLLTVFVFVTFLLNIFLAIVIFAWESFLSTRAELEEKQRFGIRSIEYRQTVESWLYRLPLMKVRYHLMAQHAHNSVDIDLHEFRAICQALNIPFRKATMIGDYFWPGIQMFWEQEQETYTVDEDDDSELPDLAHRRTIDVNVAYDSSKEPRSIQAKRSMELTQKLSQTK